MRKCLGGGVTAEEGEGNCGVECVGGGHRAGKGVKVRKWRRGKRV